VTFRDSAGALVDLTGASFILTVNEEEDPDADELAEFSLVGVVAAPLTGVVEFTLSESSADHVGRFFYDIQMTDVQGYIRTMMRGPFEMRQDITKTVPIPQSWAAEGTAGDPVPLDASDFWYGISTSTTDGEINMEFAERDGITTAAVNGSAIYKYLLLYPCYDGHPISLWGGIFEYTVLVYESGSAQFGLQMIAKTSGPSNYMILEMPIFGGEYASLSVTTQGLEDGATQRNNTTAITLPNWYRLKIRVNLLQMADDDGGKSPSFKLKIWGKDEAQPLAWDIELFDIFKDDAYHVIPAPMYLSMGRGSLSDDLEIASFSWEQVG